MVARIMSRLHSRLFSRQWYRSKLFWLLFLLLFYTLAAFFLLPRLVDQKLREAISDNLGWQTTIDEVSFHPFDLALVVSGVVVTDEQDRKALGFEALTINIDTGAAFDRALGFELTELRHPYLLVEVYEGGTETNFGRAVRAAAAKKTAAEAVSNADENVAAGNSAPGDSSIAAGEASSGDSAAGEASPGNEASLPRLRFDNVSIVDAEIDIQDASQGERVDHRLSPLNFSLLEFTTYANKDDEYRVTIDLGNQQSIRWQGVINMVTRYSKGELELSDLSLVSLQPYIKPYTDYRVSDGFLTTSMKYELSFVGDTPSFVMTDGQLTLRQLAAAVGGSDQGNFATLESLAVSEVAFDLLKKDARVGNVAVDALYFKAHRDSTGQFNFLSKAPATESSQPAEHMESAATESVGVEPALEASGSGASASDAPASGTPAADIPAVEKPFTWALGRFALAGSHIDWLDETLPAPAAIQVNDIHVSLADVNQDLSRASPFEVNLTVQDSGVTAISGTVVPATGKLSATIGSDKLALPIFQPYIDSLATVTLKSGTFSLRGQLDADPQAERKGSFEGELIVADISTLDQVEGDPLVGWTEIGLRPLTINFHPLSIAIGELLIDGPSANLLIGQDGKLNLAGLLKGRDKAASSQPVTAATPPVTVQPSDVPPATPPSDVPAATAPAGDAADIRIAKLLLKNGSVSFNDLSYDPAVDIELGSFAGEITDLSSQNQARSSLSLSGNIEDYGKLAINGNINPLSEQLYTDIRLALKNFDMTELSPYTGRFVGNAVEKGKMNVNLNYKIENQRVKADNQVLLNQFSLGQAVASEEATSLPVSLAIALMTDTEGRIDIDLPIEGDLNDPEFRVGSVVMTALSNLITKAATSPFALIGSLVGGEDGLDQVRFAAGQSKLDATQTEHLAKLAEALNERPSLGLEIRGVSNPLLDEQAIRLQRLNKKLALQRQEMGGDTAEVELLKALALKAGKVEQVALLPDVTQNPEGYRAGLLELVMADIKAGPQALRKLAGRRAAAIRKQLVDINKMSAERVFVLDPVIEEQAGETTEIVVSFALEAVAV
jgi:hypothetical protein